MYLQRIATVLVSLCLSSTPLFCAWTDLHRAAYDGKTNACKHLLKQGANIHATIKQGHTSLHLAAQNGHQDTCTLLIQYGAHVNIKTYQEKTALELAKDHETKNIIQTFIKRTDNAETPLHWAAEKGDQDTCAFLINNGANIHAKDNKGSIPLHCAAQNGHKETSALLIQNGANVHEKTNHGGWFSEGGYTPLHLASQTGHQDTCVHLLLYHANPNTKTYQGKTALELAKDHETKNVIQTFIKRTDNAETPLHWAAEKGDQDACIFLLRHHGGIYLTNHQGQTPLDLAKDDDTKQTIINYEETKISGYLATLLSTHDTPQVIIGFILSFSLVGNPQP